MAAEVAVYVLRAGCCCRAAAQRQDFGTRAHELFAHSETYARGTAENNLHKANERGLHDESTCKCGRMGAEDDGADARAAANSLRW